MMTDNDKNGAERRKYPRADLTKNLDYSFDQENWFSGNTSNISQGGAFVEGSVLARPGAKVFFRLKTPEDKIVRFIGEVIWIITEKKKRTPGMGIRFISFLSEGEKIIANLVRQHLDTIPGGAELEEEDNPDYQDDDPEMPDVAAESPDEDYDLDAEPIEASTSPPPRRPQVDPEKKKSKSGSDQFYSSSIPLEKEMAEKKKAVSDTERTNKEKSGESATTSDRQFYQNLIGRNFGNFMVAEIIGTGAMGAVFKGEDTSLGRDVGIKVLGQVFANDPAYIKQFINEARAASTLNHPNIAQIYSIGQQGKIYYYVMEFVDGWTLEEILQEKKVLTGMRSLEYMIMAAEGLGYAARKGVIHRDVKPANLMLNTDGNIKVVDFGLAKFISKDSALTQAGISLGTPFYMSPEQGLGLIVDFRSDIYSLGATFYHLYSGAPPFVGENNMATIFMHIKSPLKPLKEANGRVPQDICNVIEKCLAKDPDDRFQNYTELINILKQIRLGKGKLKPEKDEDKKGGDISSRIFSFFGGGKKKNNSFE